MKTKLLLVCSVLFFDFSILRAQIFSGPGGPITDLSSTYFDLNVSGLSSQLDTVYGLETVCINIIHTRTAELNISLITPDGTELELSTGNGDTSDNYYNTCFNDMSVDFIQNGEGPFSGTYHAEGMISYVNNGQTGDGLWRLKVSDFASLGTGNVIDWSISFGNNPPEPFSSNLPIVKIFTDGVPIPNDPKILIRLQITDNGFGARNFLTDSANNYNGWAGIELRGSGSQQYDKKSYGFETTDSLMNDTSVSILGMPAEEDWILNASFSDKTLIRNVLAYTVSEQMGHYATRWKYCELFRDGEYRGIYILSEKIKRDSNRLDIAKLTPADTLGDDLTGGYIIKLDKYTGGGGQGWTSSIPPVNLGPNPEFLYEYPKDDEILPVQESYIQNFIDSFEIVLNGPNFNDPVNGYRSCIDVGSFIDYFIVNEISKNIDGYRISTFMHKDKDSNGGLLKMGPVWDYDIAWGNANYYNGQYVFGWSYEFMYPADPWQVPFWWDRLLQDSLYTSELRCRWDTLRTGLLSTSHLFSFIDSLASYLDESQQRNFHRWPILGIQTGPNPLPIPPDYVGVIDELKDFIDSRIIMLDSNIPGTCITTALAEAGETFQNRITVFPNPSSDNVFVRQSDFNKENKLQLQIFSMDSKRIRELELNSSIVSISDLSQGVYLFEFSNGSSKWLKKVVVTGR